ncbi:hypothetical protein K875_04903 [Mycobacterium [tuberculosis] TKK-01-0051]|uniref:HEPN AbiJ-N-terminal domain-containing protein n=1 Tax=Mycobacterium [tuberculosis] TKK-01-0051 TaxID=1324261 RepID=A0A051TRF8_9MYCO|nr:hypothetical protein K875_04903 [Mycobacterium [tuberculosis] TKK-01-0051]
MQLESLDERLRTDIWNLLYNELFKPYARTAPYSLQSFWWHHFARPAEEYNDGRVASLVRQTIIEGQWYEVYDLLEFIASETPGHSGALLNILNAILEVNRAGYRIVAGQVVEITDETELESIRNAAAQPAGSPVRQHIEKAVQLFADRDNPQYANSIKESISAVEAAARDISGKPSAVLGSALDEIAKQVAPVHPALLKGWKAIYGFTSDSGGIRHADTQGSIPATQELAQYFLVTCSAMVNLLTTLQAKP